MESFYLSEKHQNNKKIGCIGWAMGIETLWGLPECYLHVNLKQKEILSD